MESRKEQIAEDIAEQLFREFSEEEIQTFLRSHPMGAAVAEIPIENHSWNGEEHSIARFPGTGEADLMAALLGMGVPEATARACLEHRELIRITQITKDNTAVVVITLYTKSCTDGLDRLHLRHVLCQLIVQTGCCDPEALRNGILDAAEAANLPPDFPLLF